MEAHSSKVRRRITTAVAAAACVTTLQFGVLAPQASAASQCTAGIGQVGPYAYCGNGPGQFRVRILCQNIFTLGSRWVWGSWFNAGGGTISTANCAWNERLYGSPGYETR
ncbi:MAG TPA: hypothetical protein VK497_02985 [Candidatus Saccharimonadales bacterium]|nr:hypothetical protein [Candidatus Saccharimonadales bacterium]